MTAPAVVEVAWGADDANTFTFAGAPVVGDMLMGFGTSPNTMSTTGTAFWAGVRFQCMDGSLAKGIYGWYRIADGTEGVGPHTVPLAGGLAYKLVCGVRISNAYPEAPNSVVLQGSMSPFGNVSVGAPNDSIKRSPALRLAVGAGLCWAGDVGVSHYAEITDIREGGASWQLQGSRLRADYRAQMCVYSREAVGSTKGGIGTEIFGGAYAMSRVVNRPGCSNSDGTHLLGFTGITIAGAHWGNGRPTLHHF
jgi:hypothetical protein